VFQGFFASRAVIALGGRHARRDAIRGARRHFGRLREVRQFARTVSRPA
jgi:hypothetical protein